MRVKVLTIENIARILMEAAAAEMFPKESFGFLVGRSRGDEANLQALYVSQDVERKETSAAPGNEGMYRVTEILGDKCIGDFHSHPNEAPRLSRISDYNRKDWQEMSDEYSMLYDKESFDGMISVIVSIFPGQRKNWLFQWAAFTAYQGRIYRVSIEMMD